MNVEVLFFGQFRRLAIRRQALSLKDDGVAILHSATGWLTMALDPLQEAKKP